MHPDCKRSNGHRREELWTPGAPALRRLSRSRRHLPTHLAVGLVDEPGLTKMAKAKRKLPQDVPPAFSALLERLVSFHPAIAPIYTKPAVTG